MQSHHILIPYSGLNFFTAAFLVFAAIFDIAMIIGVEIMISRLFNYSVAVTALSIVAATLYVVLNSLRANNSPYALSIKPFIDGTSAVVIGVSVGALYSILTLKNLEKRLSE